MIWALNIIIIFLLLYLLLLLSSADDLGERHGTLDAIVDRRAHLTRVVYHNGDLVFYLPLDRRPVKLLQHVGYADAAALANNYSSKYSLDMLRRFKFFPLTPIVALT